MRDSFSTGVLGWRAHLLLSLWDHRSLSPFVVLGGGGETIFTDSPFVDSGDTDAAVYWGIGGTYDLGPGYGIRIDLRHGLTAARTKKVANTFEGHLGFFYRISFGRNHPKVEARVMEAKPPEKANKPDGDGDGIADETDLCPKQPEIINQIDDEDGCPEVDSDNDGLLGKLDNCPMAAEDKDGFEDTDGCPDTDNDKDTIDDVVDKCPNEPETVNQFQDADGCPDTVPQPVAAFVGVIEGIRFKTGSARIYGKSKKILDNAFRTLNQYPSVRILIVGHTDNVGSARTNLSLSRKRADKVKWYLVDKGIDDLRIETIGHGAEKPITSNSTPGGRAKNRRIEFQLLPPPTPSTPLSPQSSNPAPATKTSDPPVPATKTPPGAPAPAPKPAKD